MNPITPIILPKAFTLADDWRDQIARIPPAVLEQAGKDIARDMLQRRDAEEYCRIACAGAADALLGQPWTGPLVPVVHATEVAYWPCRTKHRYPSKKDANSAVNRAMNRRRHRPEQLRAYPCPYCAGWHLTSKALRE